MAGEICRKMIFPSSYTTKPPLAAVPVPLFGWNGVRRVVEIPFSDKPGTSGAFAGAPRSAGSTRIGSASSAAVEVWVRGCDVLLWFDDELPALDWFFAPPIACSQPTRPSIHPRSRANVTTTTVRNALVHSRRREISSGGGA